RDHTNRDEQRSRQRADARRQPQARLHGDRGGRVVREAVTGTGGLKGATQVPAGSCFATAAKFATRSGPVATIASGECESTAAFGSAALIFGMPESKSGLFVNCTTDIVFGVV